MLKVFTKTASSDATDVRDTVQGILDDIEQGGDDAAMRYAAKFDQYEGNILLTDDEVEAACASVPQALKDDIAFAHDNVKRFAEVQKQTISDVELEVIPGFVLGQKSIPCNSVGCYIPGGRYSHVASAIMTVTTAKVAGCGHIVACSPPANHGNGWRAGRCFNGVWTVWFACSRYVSGAGQSVCC